MIPTILAVLTILCSVGVNLGDETQQQVHHHKVTGQPTHVTHVHRYTHQQAGQGNGGQTLQGGGGEGTQGAPQQHMRVHRVTGQQVTRVHRVTGVVQQHQHQQKTQGTTSTGAISSGAYEVISEVISSGPTSSGEYEVVSELISGGPSSEIYEVTSEIISGVPTSSEMYEVLSSVISGVPTSSVIYEEISEVISGVPTSSQIYEILSGGPGSLLPSGVSISSGPSSSEIYELLSGPGPAVSQLSEDIYELLSGGPSSGSSSVEISQVAVPAILGAKGQTSQVAPELRSNYDASLKNGGYSFEGAFGVNQRRRCDRGLIDRAATGIRNTVNGGVGNLMGAISSLTDSGTALGPVGGLVNAVGHAGGHLIQGKLNEIDFMVNDAACGLGNIANAAVDMLKTGDIAGGVGRIGKELLGGVGNMGEDLLSQAAEGIGNAANDLLGFLGGLGGAGGSKEKSSVTES